MQSGQRAASAPKPLGQRREWIASREAIRLVSEGYALHDIAEYPSDQDRRRAAMARAADAMFRRLAEGTLPARPVWFRFVLGNRDDGSESQFHLQEQDRVISPNFWRTLARLRPSAVVDWIAGDFAFEEVDGAIYAIGSASGVKFDRSALPALDLLTTKPAPNAGGAPRKWDWDGALLHLAAVAHCGKDGLYRDDGKEPNQSDIARYLRAWFIDAYDEAPESSQLRDYGKRFTIALNDLKFKIANNPDAAG